MSDYLLLLKTILNNNFRNSKNMYFGNKSKLSKNIYVKIINIVGIILGIAAMLVWICFLVYTMSVLCAIEKISIEFLSMIFTGAQLMTIFFGIQSVLSNTFFSKDNEFLAQLPVKPKLIFAVKMSVIYINELILSTMLLLPMIISFILGSLLGGLIIPVYFYFFIPLILILAPVIPLMFVTILSFPLIKIVSYFKNRSAVTLITSILLFVLLMASYMLVIPNIDKFFSVEGQASIITPQLRKTIIGTGNSLFFNKSAADAMLGQKIAVNLLIYLVTVTASIGIALFLSSLLYAKAVSKIGEEARIKSDKKIEIENVSKRKMLFMREFKTLFRDQSFAFNSVLGSILSPLIIALMYFVGFNKTGTANTAGQVINTFSQDFSTTGLILFYSLMMMCGMNYSATVAFTREGNTFYILRYLPVKITEIIDAKVNLAHAISAVGLVFTAIVSAFIVKIKIYNLLPLILSVGLFQYAFNYLGVYRDLKKPNITWTNAYEALKKNVYPMIPMFIAMGIGTVFMIMAQFVPFIKLSEQIIVFLYWLIVLLVAVGMIIAVKISIKKNAESYFNRINVE